MGVWQPCSDMKFQGGYFTGYKWNVKKEAAKALLTFNENIIDVVLNFWAG